MALNEIAGVAADVGAQSVALSFPASAFRGVQSLDGATVYVTTWDFDGIGNSFRALDAMPAEWTYGGGTPNGARIQDAITLQLK